MKQFSITYLSLVFCFCVKAQNTLNITIGKKEVLTSAILKEKRNLWIYTPTETSQIPNPDKRYPVLYVLDGEAQFYATVGILQHLSQANGNGVLPEMIVVGIENTNRFKDLIPSVDTKNPNPFIDFLSKELIPHMDKNYKTAPYKVLVGHSLGGLMAVDILTHFPDLFNACIAIDPSMWYNNEKYLINITSNFHKQNIVGKRLFIGMANTLPKGMTISQLKKDKSLATQHIRSIIKLDSYFKTNKRGLSLKSKYYENESHNSVPLISQYDGLRFIFDYYHLDADEKDFADSSNVIAKKLRTHYQNVSEKMGYQNAAPAALINYLAYDALGKKQYSKAKALFDLNIEWYPQNSNVYDSYAEYCLAQKDTATAISFFQKALTINENVETQKKIHALINKNIAESIDLNQYAGVYILERYNIPIVLEVRENILFAKVPGQADDEFVLISKDVFTVKGKQGYTITFQMNGKKPLEFTSVQPNGSFKAVYKNE